ncbi:MAG: hypothetical protein ACWA6Y_09580 [Polaromonas sp.]
MTPQLFTDLFLLVGWPLRSGSRRAAAGLLVCLALPVLPVVLAHAGEDAGVVRQARSLQGAQTWRDVSAWIRTSGDNGGKPFAIIDKKAATVHIFGAAGDWRASSPVLLGLAVGDESVPGIGERKMADIKPHERITPAGRFVSEPGVNLQGEDIVWIDYDAAVSMHRVRTSNKADRRLHRLATPSVADNRISYGCVNVPVAFYDRFVKPALGAAPAVVYVLPETHPLSDLPGLHHPAS